MCLILLAYKEHPRYKLVFAANRDEFYARPSIPAHFWESSTQLLAGRDMKAGGTWLGITKQGRFAAVTNYRDMSEIKSAASSRGGLTKNFLLTEVTPQEYFDQLKSSAKEYNGYNLIFGTIDKLYYFSNEIENLETIPPGIHGLSNHLLNTPWQKVEKGKKELRNILNDSDDPPVKKIFSLLKDRSFAPDNQLTNTGIGIELERVLSSVFIKSGKYGTRSSTVVLVDNQNNVSFEERTFNSSEKYERVEFSFSIDI